MQDEAEKKKEVVEKNEVTKAANNRLALLSLAGIALACISVSAGVLIEGGPGAGDLVKEIFAPVGIIAAGLLGIVKG